MKLSTLYNKKAKGDYTIFLTDMDSHNEVAFLHDDSVAVIVGDENISSVLHGCARTSGTHIPEEWKDHIPCIGNATIPTHIRLGAAMISFDYVIITGAPDSNNYFVLIRNTGSAIINLVPVVNLIETKLSRLPRHFRAIISHPYNVYQIPHYIVAEIEQTQVVEPVPFWSN